MAIRNLLCLSPKQREPQATSLGPERKMTYLDYCHKSRIIFYLLCRHRRAAVKNDTSEEKNSLEGLSNVVAEDKLAKQVIVPALFSKFTFPFLIAFISPLSPFPGIMSFCYDSLFGL